MNEESLYPGGRENQEAEFDCRTKDQRWRGGILNLALFVIDSFLFLCHYELMPNF